ncbi:MAG: hypothetical protein ACLR7D_02045 [Lachnospira eligens]
MELLKNNNMAIISKFVDDWSISRPGEGEKDNNLGDKGVLLFEGIDISESPETGRRNPFK